MPSTIPVARKLLVELFARVASATRLASFLGEHRSPPLEKLTGHINAIFEELSGLLGAAQLTVDPLPTVEGNAPDSPLDADSPLDTDSPLDADSPLALDSPLDAADTLRLLMGRADALAAATDGQFARGITIGDADNRRDFRRIAHLVELTAAAVAEASDATDKLIAALERSLSPGES